MRPNDRFGLLKKPRPNLGQVGAQNCPIFGKSAQSSANEGMKLNRIDAAKWKGKSGGAGRNRTDV
ncbi:MAG: hypothetical protein DMG97_35160 [Acidobacteria bacterium]|nr:MAG: hypothetical protein DMG98_18765 [Acidobacteriota bacterium]PYV64341.1 MAG: hypothetical protein DMG97_35160 [Acidobacteriota bacterium]PYV75218.1 MAG: hypothetical protein DMG96_17925 [Acidobacteriota bacterium]